MPVSNTREALPNGEMPDWMWKLKDQLPETAPTSISTGWIGAGIALLALSFMSMSDDLHFSWSVILILGISGAGCLFAGLVTNHSTRSDLAIFDSALKFKALADSRGRRWSSDDRESLKRWHQWFINRAEKEAEKIRTARSASWIKKRLFGNGRGGVDRPSLNLPPFVGYLSLLIENINSLEYAAESGMRASINAQLVAAIIRAEGIERKCLGPLWDDSEKALELVEIEAEKHCHNWSEISRLIGLAGKVAVRKSITEALSVDKCEREPKWKEAWNTNWGRVKLVSKNALTKSEAHVAMCDAGWRLESRYLVASIDGLPDTEHEKWLAKATSHNETLAPLEQEAKEAVAKLRRLTF